MIEELERETETMTAEEGRWKESYSRFSLHVICFKEDLSDRSSLSLWIFIKLFNGLRNVSL